MSLPKYTRSDIDAALDSYKTKERRSKLAAVVASWDKKMLDCATKDSEKISKLYFDACPIGNLKAEDIDGLMRSHQKSIYTLALKKSELDDYLQKYKGEKAAIKAKVDIQAGEKQALLLKVKDRISSIKGKLQRLRNFSVTHDEIATSLRRLKLDGQVQLADQQKSVDNLVKIYDEIVRLLNGGLVENASKIKELQN